MHSSNANELMATRQSSRWKHAKSVHEFKLEECKMKYLNIHLSTSSCLVAKKAGMMPSTMRKISFFFKPFCTNLCYFSPISMEIFLLLLSLKMMLRQTTKVMGGGRIARSACLYYHQFSLVELSLDSSSLSIRARLLHSVLALAGK